MAQGTGHWQRKSLESYEYQQIAKTNITSSVKEKSQRGKEDAFYYRMAILN